MRTGLEIGERGGGGAGRRAAMSLSASAEENSPSGALLMDIFVVFILLKVERLFSRTLAAGLHEFRDRPWSEGLSGKGYTELWLAEQLQPYGIRPATIRIGEEVGRGYLKEDFGEVFLRYIPASEVEALRQKGKRTVEDSKREAGSTKAEAGGCGTK